MAVLARLALLAVALGAAACTHGRGATGASTADGVRLIHRAPEGAAVWIIGDFNGWQAGPDPMAHADGDRYEVVLHLPPGTYAYAFAHGLPDGGLEIVTPEGAAGYVEDDLGGRDGLIRVGAPQ